MEHLCADLLNDDLSVFERVRSAYRQNHSETTDNHLGRIPHNSDNGPTEQLDRDCGNGYNTQNHYNKNYGIHNYKDSTSPIKYNDNTGKTT